MASIEKRNGRWRVRWREAGRSRSQQCPDLKTAKRVQREVERAQAVGEQWRPRGDAAAPGLAEMMEAYLDAGELRWKPRTVELYRFHLQELLRSLRRARPRGRLAADLFDREALTRLWADVRERASARHANECVRTVERFWRWAFDSDAYGDDVPRPRRLDLAPSRPTRELRVPTWPEVDRAIDEAGGDWLPRLLLLGSRTGLRVSQVGRLEWRDVDLGARTLTIRGELGKTSRESAGRVVPLAPVLAAEMAGWGVREGRVLDLPNPAWVSQRAKAAWLRAGVEGVQPTHGLRKCFISELVRSGVRLEVVERLVGHAPRSVAMAHYVSGAALWDEMVAAVAMVPAAGASNVEPLRRREGGA